VTLLARHITDGVMLDTSTKLSRSECDALYSAGVRSVWRYVFFGPPRPGDLDSAELANILAAGLTCLVVQHVRNPGWHASADQGDADGQVAVANAQKAGYASAGGVLSLALDMEGCATVDASAHAQAWCAAVRAGGYAPVVSVGYASGLTGHAIDALGVPAWCDFAPLSARPAPTKGYALHQQAQTIMCGIGVDVDLVLQPGVIVGLADGDVAAGDKGITNDPLHSRDTEPPPDPAA
jgi:hypothetical protein